MKQRVKPTSYLTRNSIDFGSDFTSSLTKECAMLPVGAEIMQVNLEITQECDAGITADIGFGKSLDLFANDIDIATKGNHNSSVITSANVTGVVNITLSAKPTKGSGVLRVVYFLPSEVMTEYN